MRVRLMAIAGVLCLASSSGLLAQRQIQLLATVTDPNGGEVAAVAAGDVRVAEDGAPARVVAVQPVDRVPKLQILVDNGTGFPAEALSDLRSGLRVLIEALPPDLEVTLVTTSPQPRFLERATTDRQRQLDALSRLAPDSGVGRFVESLAEATQRMEEDPDGRYVILSLATSAGDNNVRERDVEQIQQRVLRFTPVVHVVHLVSAGRTSLGGGAIQGELGQAVAQMSSGRYENINQTSRVATLLPELAQEIAQALGAGSRQFRITVERPEGASGDLGRVTLGIAGTLVTGVSLDQR